MRTFQLHILAADRVFFEGECESVVAPTASGQYGVQAHHSNMIAAISPGELTFRTAQGVLPQLCNLRHQALHLGEFPAGPAENLY